MNIGHWFVIVLVLWSGVIFVVYKHYYGDK